MTTNNLVSVIIPVYNVEKFVERSIDSVLRQTYTKFELILIDDGSTDSSYAICKYYEDIDNRVKVFTKTNSGPSDTRNFGLNKANGKWIVFVDSDDFVENKYLENFFDFKFEDEYTHVVQSFKSINEDGSKGSYSSPNYKDAFIHCRNDKAKLLSSNRLIHRWGVWGKLYSAAIIRKHNLKFDSRFKIFEDGLFWHQYILHVDKIILRNVQNYHYYQYSSRVSISKSKLAFDQYFELANIYKDLSKKMISHFDLTRHYQKEVYSIYADRFIIALLKINCAGINHYESFVRLEQIQPKRIELALNYLPQSLIKRAIKCVNVLLGLRLTISLIKHIK